MGGTMKDILEDYCTIFDVILEDNSENTFQDFEVATLGV